MRVHVDPAGRHQEAGSINLAPSRTELAADFGDALARDRHVAIKCRLPGPIDDGPATNDDVVHGSLRGP
jgi:hypothetical protein